MSDLFEVSADVRYLDGSLHGLVVPSGYRLNFMTQERAIKVAGWINGVRKAGDFVRSACAGSRYQFESDARVVRMSAWS